ncbi:MAG TPA: NACHT domain-containing protein [Thermoanaerobaculia bacterium]|nr:NACHT domain-containing protein [Thermoanaerobaculia bacterium]
MVTPTFSSEELLRQAFANLLSRIPEVSDVQILHGHQEYGKDIIFWTKGPLGEKLPCACVIKNSEITGSVGKNSGARTVCLQAEQALDTPFVDAAGQEQKIHRVYIVTPAAISADAMNSIRGRLSQRSGQIIFVPGERLFDLFRTYWLDFFVDEFNSLETHLKQIESQGENRELQQAANLYGIESEAPDSATIYVRRSLRHTFVMVDFDTSVLYPLPGQGRLNEPWRKFDVQETLAAINQLAASWEHFERWSLLKSPRSEFVAYQLKLFATSLESSWLTAARAESKDWVTLKSAPPGPFDLPDVDRLAEIVELLTPLLREALQPLWRACQISRDLINKDLSFEAIFTPEAQSVFALEDCLRTAPARLLGATAQRTIEINELVVRNSTNSLMVVGPAGYGKTSFCRWNALLDAQSYRSGAASTFPVYIPLHSLSSEKSATYQQGFFKRAGISALLPTGEGNLPGRIRLYLDGLDEVSSATQRQQLVSLAQQAHDDGIQVILTSRDSISAPWLSWLPKLYLSELDSDAQEELLRGWLGETPHLAVAFRNQLMRSGALAEPMRVPLLATLVILVFKQTRNLPESRARLYSDFVDLLSGGWDLAKGVLRASRFGRLVKVMVLAHLAAKAHGKGSRYFDGRLLGSAIRSVLNDAGKSTILALTGELIVDGVISRSADRYFFSHLSFQEFLCAKQMSGLPSTKAIEKAIRDFLAGDDWWWEVIQFYISLSENPLGLAEWLFAKLDQADVNSGFRAQEIWKSIELSFPGFRLSSWMDSRLRSATAQP